MKGILVYFFYLLFCLKMVMCCDCNLEDMIKEAVIKSSNMDKRQMNDDVVDDSVEIMEDSETPEGTTEVGTTRMKNIFFRITESTAKYSPPIKECRFYKDAPEFNFEKMVDVWKIAFYKAFDKLSCFKIHIKKTAMEVT